MWSSWFAHSIRGCRPLWRALRVLIPSPCVNNSRTLIFKIRRPSTFSILVFPTFSSNKHWWWLHAFFFPWKTHNRVSRRAPSEGQVATVGDSTGDVRELGHSVSVQYFYHDFLFIYFPFSLLSFVCPYVYIILLCCCVWCVFIYRLHS